MLTQDFKNAPAPTNSPSPQSYGIRVNKTSLGSVVNVADDDPLGEFLGRSFGFRCQPQLLGVVTNQHEHLSYAENTIDSPGVNALADLHDLLIDSEKNGFTYTFEAYSRFMRSCKDIKIKQCPEPAYKHVTKAEMDSTPLGRRQSPKELPYNPKHITDKLVFEIVRPHIEETLQQVEASFAKAQSEDVDLKFVYNQYRNGAEEDASVGDEALHIELDSLEQRLMQLKDRFSAERTTKKVDMNNFDQYLDQTERFYHEYRTLMPVAPERLQRSLRRTLLMPRGTDEPTDWDLLKASTLHATCHQARGFVFQIAGKELVSLKCAASPSRTRRLVQPMWEIMKPRKATKAEANLESPDLRDDDDAKSERAAESLIDDVE